MSGSRNEYDRSALHHVSEEAKDLLAKMLEKAPRLLKAANGLEMPRKSTNDL